MKTFLKLCILLFSVIFIVAVNSGLQYLSMYGPEWMLTSTGLLGAGTIFSGIAVIIGEIIAAVMICVEIDNY